MSSVGLASGLSNHSNEFRPTAHERSPMPYAYRVVLMVPLTVIITFTVGGNLLTVIVMRLDRRLRSQPVTSMYIASLAGADLLVGLIVMTFMLLYTITYDGRWVFGSAMCTIWTCVDYLSCTASLTNVFLIAVDRYRSVSQPLQAIRRRTRRRACLFMATAWLVPAFFWVSIICLMRAKTDEMIATRQARGSSSDPQRKEVIHSSSANLSSSAEDPMELDSVCDTRWHPPELAIIAVVIMFYIPLVAILVLFALIMCVLRRHMIAMTERIRRTLSLGNESGGANGDDALPSAAATNAISGGCTQTTTTTTTMAVHGVDPSSSAAAAKEGPPRSSPPMLVSCYNKTDRKRSGEPEVKDQALRGCTARTKMENVQSIRFCSRNSETRVYAPRDHSEGGAFGDSKEGSSTCSDGTAAREPLHWARGMRYAATAAAAEVPPRVHHQRYASQLLAQRQGSLQELRLRQQIKAARILGAITVSLLLCWIPFSVMLAIKAFCSDCLSQRTFDVAIWINYINSGINPIIYCLCNSQYRQALLKIARRAKCSRCDNCAAAASCRRLIGL